MVEKFLDWLRMSKQTKTASVPGLRFPEFKKSDEWILKPFSLLFKIGNGKDYKHLSNGNIPVYGSGGYMLSVNDHLYDGESACIGRKGTIDKPIFLTGKFWTVDTLFYTHSFVDCIPKFIFYMFQGIVWTKHNEAGGVPSLSKEIINKIKRFVPPGVDEQKKITDCLSSIDDLITAQSEKVNFLKNYKKGLLQQLFPQEGETVPRLRFPKFKKSGEWKMEKLGDLTTKIGSGITPKGGSENYKTSGRPFIRSQNVGRGYLILDDVVHINEQMHSTFSSTEIKLNDVLLNITGASIGRSVVADKRIVGGNVNQHVCIIRYNGESLHPTYLCQYLLSPYGQNQIDSFQGGGNREGLNFAQIRSFVLPLPKSLDEQKLISDLFFSLDELTALENDKFEQLKSHKNGLLQKLFPEIESDEKGNS